MELAKYIYLFLRKITKLTNLFSPELQKIKSMSDYRGIPTEALKESEKHKQPESPPFPQPAGLHWLRRPRPTLARITAVLSWSLSSSVRTGVNVVVYYLHGMRFILQGVLSGITRHWFFF